jgi:probable F420-dependent oxidoreductase
VKFSAQLPLGLIDPPGEFQSAAAVAEMARALEAAGVDGGYITDHPAPDTNWLHANGHDALDPFTALAFVAAATTRLRLHTNIVVLAYRNPFITAKAGATLQVLSGGRLILGIGAGYQKNEFEALGVDFHRRGALTDEALEVIRQAWAGGVVTRKGFTFDAPGNEPRPVPNPPPTIWVGGGSDKALERAARFGDGWCPFYSAPNLSKLNQETGIQSVAHLTELASRVRERRAALGKTGPFDVVIGPRMSLKTLSSETAERFLQGLEELRGAGVTWATADLPHPSRAGYLEAVQWFGDEIVAKAK